MEKRGLLGKSAEGRRMQSLVLLQKMAATVVGWCFGEDVTLLLYFKFFNLIFYFNYYYFLFLFS